MDKKKTITRPSFFSGIVRVIKEEAHRRRTERGALFMDIAVFLISLFFSRRHIVFSTYPLGAALVGTLPSRVWVSLFGVLFGAFSLGRSGVIHAIIALIIVFLRVMISGTQSGEDGMPTLFREPYVMRVASVAIGSFVGGIYEILLNSFSISSVLFGCAGVLFSVALSFAYFGVLTSDIHISDILGGGKNIFTGKVSDRQNAERILFQGSALVFFFFVALSLDGYDFFGISLSYIFVSAVTLFVAKRFGATRGMAVGFVSAIGINAIGAVGFGIAGLAAGLLFSVGLGYALFGGAALLCAWCAYAGGLNLFLSTLPEYGVAALIMTPYLKGAKKENDAPVSESISKSCADMVASAAASYRERELLGQDIERALIFAHDAISDYGMGSEKGEFDEYRNIVIAATASLDPTPCEENIDALASKLYKKAQLSDDEIARLLGLCEENHELCESIRELVGEYEHECYDMSRMSTLADEYELISKMINSAKFSIEKECAHNGELSRRLTGAFNSLGFPDGCVRVLGERVKMIIAAAEDESGEQISASAVREKLQTAIGAPLTAPEFYRRDNIALMQCKTAPVWRFEEASVSSASEKTGLSGDSTVSFEKDGVFYSVLSDGMGSGSVARRTSRFVCDYLSGALSVGISLSVFLESLNHIIKYRGEECSATADVFSLDLYTGDAVFTKCGAAPSYVKHSDSIFRIRSHTAPLGLMRAVDYEDIRVEIKSGDYVIMLSDGVGVLPEEVPWLVEFLSRPTDLAAKDYAEKILELIKKNSSSGDDITVSVARIFRSY